MQHKCHLGQVSKGVLGLQLSSQYLLVFIHLLGSRASALFSSFRSGWGFCFSSNEPFSFCEVSFLGCVSANILTSNYLLTEFHLSPNSLKVGLG